MSSQENSDPNLEFHFQATIFPGSTVGWGGQLQDRARVEADVREDLATLWGMYLGGSRQWMSSPHTFCSPLGLIKDVARACGDTLAAVFPGVFD